MLVQKFSKNFWFKMLIRIIDKITQEPSWRYRATGYNMSISFFQE